MLTYMLTLIFVQRTCRPVVSKVIDDGVSVMSL